MIKIKYTQKFKLNEEWEKDLTKGKIYEAIEESYNDFGELVYCEIKDDIREEVTLTRFRIQNFKEIN